LEAAVVLGIEDHVGLAQAVLEVIGLLFLEKVQVAAIVLSQLLVQVLVISLQLQSAAAVQVVQLILGKVETAVTAHYNTQMVQ
jgi:hypothetical protein